MLLFLYSIYLYITIWFDNLKKRYKHTYIIELVLKEEKPYIKIGKDFIELKITKAKPGSGFYINGSYFTNKEEDKLPEWSFDNSALDGL